MSGYIGTQPVPQATQNRESFTATSSQTSFATIGYTPQFLDVYLNGVHLLNGTDYTATNGSDVVLTTAAASGDVLEVVSYSTYEVNSQNYTGGLTVDNDGATVLTVDRATSDGTIIDVQKNGTTVGSIGTDAVTTGSNSLTIDSGSNGTLTLEGMVKALNTKHTGTPRFQPTTDNAIDLGSGSYRFKDLYLSGGVYLGGTGSANLLDSYEEGTWTPVIEGNSPVGTGVYYIQFGSYIKVGNLVTANGYVQSMVHTGGGSQIKIGGFPFTVASGADQYGVPSYGEITTLTKSSDTVLSGYILPTDSRMLITQISTTSSGTTSNIAFDVAFSVLFTVTYRVA